MTNEIISYMDMCQREGGSLQKGMNFKRGGNYSVILMSVRLNAPYKDTIHENGCVLIYEGHDAPNNSQNIDPKKLDQPEFTPNGKLTENGKFFKAAYEHKHNAKEAELVKVYEKIKPGIWSYNGLFKLVDAWKEHDGHRTVFKFKLKIIESDQNIDINNTESKDTRIIPTAIKLTVWQRDQGKCSVCGSKVDLHFDHIIPYSKGGSSTTADNIQLLCSKHNLEKRDKIE